MLPVFPIAWYTHKLQCPPKTGCAGAFELSMYDGEHPSRSHEELQPSLRRKDLQSMESERSEFIVNKLAVLMGYPMRLLAARNSGVTEEK